ncbi:MAG: hypothetical protein V8R16_07800 [Bacilli bacterium]
MGALEKNKKHFIDVVVDRLILKENHIQEFLILFQLL